MLFMSDYRHQLLATLTMAFSEALLAIQHGTSADTHGWMHAVYYPS